MKNKLIIFILAACFMVLGGVKGSLYAADTNPSTEPYAVGTTTTPSESSYLDSRKSLGASTDAQLMSAPTRGLTRAVDGSGERGWGDLVFPGENGELGEPGNVGYPVGDASLPILLSMIVIYFLYRGIASTKRRSNF